MSTRRFAAVQAASPDPIFVVTARYVADTRQEKVNLGVGMYMDETGKVPVLDTVREERVALMQSNPVHSYLPIRGLSDFRTAAQELVFGKDSEIVRSGRAATVQALGGTGAITLGTDFMRNICGATVGAASNPTWGNHNGIMKLAGMQVQAYRYYDAAHFGIDFDGMVEDLERLPAGAMPIFHACCHNPTGYDLSVEQWKVLVALCEKNGLTPILDLAYQGFREGLREDAFAVDLFAASGMDFLVASSYSKSFGLYSERVGALSVVTQSREQADRVVTHLETLARSNYSNPPAFGGRLVAGILTDPTKRSRWESEVAVMRERIRAMRVALVEETVRLGAKRDFSFITRQAGMFSFTGFTPEQVQRLEKEYAIYAVRNGRICICGLNTGNVKYVAKAFTEVL